MARGESDGLAADTGGSKGTTSSRERILDAAVQVAVEDGILAMTLDAVARKAGVSKGGLIHHFRSKDDLIAAMLEHFRNRVRRTLDALMAADPNPRGRWLRAFVHTVFGAGPHDSGQPARTPEMARFLTAMLAASAKSPHLLDPVRAQLSQIRAMLIAEGPNGVRQLALWPAVYGLVLWQHLGIIGRDDPAFRSMLDELLMLAEGPEPA